MMDPANDYPPYPTFSEDELAKCRDQNDYTFVLAAWYKYVGLVTIHLGEIISDETSPPKLELTILRGLLNRCSRLMLAVLIIAQKGKHGESVRILSRSISETAVTVEWLILKQSDDSFKRYLANGLKAEIKLEKQIQGNIKARIGTVHQIEQRMLKSISEYISLSGLSRDEILNTKGFPDLKLMYSDLKLSDLAYVVSQNLSSQYVHGTWSDLLTHYLRVDKTGQIVLRDNDVWPEQNIFSFTALSVLRALSSYSKYFFLDEEVRQAYLDYFADIQVQILEITRGTSGDDYEPVTTT